MASRIERRKFLATLGGAAAAWPLAARVQRERRCIGVLLPATSDDSAPEMVCPIKKRGKRASESRGRLVCRGSTNYSRFCTHLLCFAP
jgi:hypothetical protein